MDSSPPLESNELPYNFTRNHLNLYSVFAITIVFLLLEQMGVNQM